MISLSPYIALKIYVDRLAQSNIFHVLQKILQLHKLLVIKTCRNAKQKAELCYCQANWSTCENMGNSLVVNWLLPGLEAMWAVCPNNVGSKHISGSRTSASWPKAGHNFMDTKKFSSQLLYWAKQLNISKIEFYNYFTLSYDFTIQLVTSYGWTGLLLQGIRILTRFV